MAVFPDYHPLPPLICEKWFQGRRALFGLIGLFVRQLSQAGTLGLVAFIVAFIGTAFFFGLGMITEFVLPDFADKAPELYLPSGPYGADSDRPTPPIIPLSFVTFLVGHILMGIAVMRAKVLPRWSGAALIVGSVVFFPAFPWPIPLVGAVIFGAALGWIGYALWTETTEEIAQAQPAT